MSTKPGPAVMHPHLFYPVCHISSDPLTHVHPGQEWTSNHKIDSPHSKKTCQSLWHLSLRAQQEKHKHPLSLNRVRELDFLGPTCSWINDNLWVLCPVSSLNVCMNRNKLLFVHTGANNSMILHSHFTHLRSLQLQRNASKPVILMHHF